VEGFFTGCRPGGFGGDRDFVFEPESAAARRPGLAEDIGAFGIGGLAKTFGSIPDPLAALLWFAETERSVCGGVAGFAVNIGGRGSLICLNCATIALCPEICLLTASAARFSLCGVGESGEDEGGAGGELMRLR